MKIKPQLLMLVSGGMLFMMERSTRSVLDRWKD